MKRIKFIVGITHPYAVNKEFDVEDAEADRMLAANFAVEVKSAKVEGDKSSPVKATKAAPVVADKSESVKPESK